jgi:membrane protein
MIITVKFWEIFKDAIKGFFRHKGIKLSASLSYFTIFTLGPFMLIILFFSNLYWGNEAIDGKFYNTISGYVGEKAAQQILEVINNASISGNGLIAVVSFVILVIAATTAFAEMRDSINVIWNLKVRKGKSGKQMLRSRLLSFTMVTGLSLLLLLSLIANGLLEGFKENLMEVFPNNTVSIMFLINLVMTLLVVAFLYAIINKVLPYASIRWKDVIPGAILSAVLFIIGKFLITFVVKETMMGNSYGSAGSSIILMLWIFYSSIILYFGVEFTKAYALKYGSEIIPKKNSVTIRILQIESNEHSVQINEQKINEIENGNRELS